MADSRQKRKAESKEPWRMPLIQRRPARFPRPSRIPDCLSMEATAIKEFSRGDSFALKNFTKVLPLKRRLSIHQHLLQAEILEYPLLADYVDPRMNKFHADLLIRLNLLGTRESELKSIVLETVAGKVQLLRFGVQEHSHAQLRHALACPIIAQQALIILDVRVKSNCNQNAIGKSGRQEFARASVERRLLLGLHGVVMRVELR